MNRIIGYSLFLLIFHSCSSEPAESTNAITYKIDLNTIEDSPMRVVGMIEVSRLDTSNVMGEVWNMCYDDDYYYFLDRKSSAVSVYNKALKFVGRVGNKGRAANEFLRADAIDLVDGNMYIYDGYGRKILCYDQNRNFVRAIKQERFINSFIVDGERILLDNGNTRSNETDKWITAVDLQSGDEIDEIIPKDEKLRDVNICPYSPFVRSDDNITFHPTATNKIYTIKDKTPSLKYIFDFGEHWPNDEFFEKISQGKAHQQLKNGLGREFVKYLNFIESDDFIVLSFTVKEIPAVAVIEKSTSRVRVFKNNKEKGTMSRPQCVIDGAFCAAYLSENRTGIIRYTIDMDKPSR